MVVEYSEGSCCERYRFVAEEKEEAVSFVTRTLSLSLNSR